MPIAVAALAGAVAVDSGPTALDGMAEPGRLGAGEPVLAVGFAVTALGGSDVALALALSAALALLVARLWHAALALVLAVVSTQLAVDLIKHAVERPRPSANASLADAGGFSFPSGHSATSAALFGTLALVALRYAPRRVRMVGAGLALAAALAIGATRVLLGAHYPTDVIAGWLTGATIAVVSLALLRRVRRRVAPRPQPAR